MEEEDHQIEVDTHVDVVDVLEVEVVDQEDEDVVHEDVVEEDIIVHHLKIGKINQRVVKVVEINNLIIHNLQEHLITQNIQ